MLWSLRSCTSASGAPFESVTVTATTVPCGASGSEPSVVPSVSSLVSEDDAGSPSMVQAAVPNRASSAARRARVCHGVGSVSFIAPSDHERGRGIQR